MEIKNTLDLYVFCFSLYTCIVSGVVSGSPYCAFGAHSDESIAHVVALNVAYWVRVTVQSWLQFPTIPCKKFIIASVNCIAL